jgi:hypothetical protein
MSIAYLAKLRAQSEARRAAYKERAERATMPRIIMRKISAVHMIILPEGKEEPCDPSDEYVYDSMVSIAQRVADLSQLANKNEYQKSIEGLFELANLISDLHNLPQLRRIYNCGELIYGLYHMSSIDMPKIQNIVTYITYITTQLTSAAPTNYLMYKVQNTRYERAVGALHQKPDVNLMKTLFNNICGAA